MPACVRSRLSAGLGIGAAVRVEVLAPKQELDGVVAGDHVTLILGGEPIAQQSLVDRNVDRADEVVGRDRVGDAGLMRRHLELVGAEVGARLHVVDERLTQRPRVDGALRTILTIRGVVVGVVDRARPEAEHLGLPVGLTRDPPDLLGGGVVRLGR
jgi:hypothetical protein